MFCIFCSWVQGRGRHTPHHTCQFRRRRYVWKKENKKRSEKIINYYDMLQEGKIAWHWMKYNMGDCSILFWKEYLEQSSNGFSEQWSSLHSGTELKLTLYENYSLYYRKTITFHSIPFHFPLKMLWFDTLTHTYWINVWFILFTNLENWSKQTACQRVVCISSTKNCTPFNELNKQN